MSMHYRNFEAIPLQEAFAMAPTLKAVAPYEKTSERYRMISTADVLESLNSEGFAIHGLQVTKTRLPDRRAFAKHIVRLRKRGDVNGTEAPEVVLINAHDGNSPWVLFAGIIRFICCNGMVMGERFASARVPHVGKDTLSRVIEGTYSVVENFEGIRDRIDAMKARELSDDEVHEFATRAHQIRFPNSDKAPISPDAMLTVRRSEDAGASLWNVFNRAQETAIRGGVRSLTRVDGRWRQRSARAIRGIDSAVSVNRQMFDLADEFLAA